MSVLHLLRHAPVKLTAGICYGASDVDAVSLSSVQLLNLRDRINSGVVVWSSPLRRCRVLAEELCPTKKGVRIDPRLREMDFGDWELQRFDDLDRAKIDEWAADPWNFVPPGGESANSMRERVVAALRDVLHDAGPRGEVLIVAHAGPLRVIRGSVLGLPREHWLSQPCEPASLDTVRFAAR